MFINRIWLYILLILLLLNLTIRHRQLSAPSTFVMTAVIYHPNNNDYEYLDAMARGDTGDLQYDFPETLEAPVDEQEGQELGEIREYDDDDVVDVADSSSNQLMGNNLQKTKDYLNSEKRRDSTNNIDPGQSDLIGGACGPGQMSPEQRQEAVAEQQDMIDHVTSLIKSMREHAIGIIKDMNDLETDFLGCSSENCNTGANASVTGAATGISPTATGYGNPITSPTATVTSRMNNINKLGLGFGTSSFGGTCNPSGSDAGSDSLKLEVDTTTTTTPCPPTTTTCLTTTTTTTMSPPTTTTCPPTTTTCPPTTTTFLPTTTSCLPITMPTTTPSPCGGNSSNMPDPIFVLNEWSVPTLNTQVSSSNGNELMTQAQEAVRSWQDQIETCKRMLNAAAAQVAQLHSANGIMQPDAQQSLQPTGASIPAAYYTDTGPSYSNSFSSKTTSTDNNNNINDNNNNNRNNNMMSALSSVTNSPLTSFLSLGPKLLHTEGANKAGSNNNINTNSGIRVSANSDFNNNNNAFFRHNLNVRYNNPRTVKGIFEGRRHAAKYDQIGPRTPNIWNMGV